MKNIYTLSLSPAIDTTIYMGGLQIGAETEAESEHSEAGGKGANVARALAAKGIDCTCICLLGRDNSDIFLSLISGTGVRCITVFANGHTRENLSFQLANGHTRVLRKGFSVQPEHCVKICELLEKSLCREDLVLVGGKLPQGMSGAELVKICSVIKSKGAEIYLDTSSLKLSEISQIAPKLLKPNRSELEAITHMPCQTVEQAVEAGKILLANGCESLLISMDSDGGIFMDRKETIYAQAQKISVKSAVGAGDCMLAEFTAALREGKNHREALGLAVAAGSASCMDYGTRPPKTEDTVRLAQSVTCTIF